MKTLLYTIFILVFYIPPIFLSCSQEDLSDNYQPVEDNLIILNSDKKPVTEMSKQEYMEYVLYKVEQNFLENYYIAGDTVIFEAQKYFSQINDVKNAGYASLYAGIVSFNKNLYGEGLKYFTQGVVFAEQIGDYILLGRCQNNAGFIHYEAGDKEKAIPYYLKALEAYSMVENTEKHELLTLRFLSLSYNIIGEYDNALLYCRKGLDLAKSQNNNPYIATFTHIFGIIYYHTGKYQLSEKYLKEALALTQDKEERFRVHLSFALSYVKQKRPDLAEPYILYLENNIGDADYPYTLENAYYLLHNYYSGKKDFEKTLYYLELQRDEILNIKEMAIKDKEVSEAREEIVTTEKAKENQILQQQNNWLIISIIAIVTIIVCVAVYVMMRMRRYFDNRKEDREILRIYYRQKMEALLPSKAPYVEVANGLMGISNESRLKENPLSTEEEITFDNLGEYTKWADDYLKTQDLYEKLSGEVEEFDKIFLAMCANGYTDSKMAILLQMDEEDVILRKLKMRDILEKHGVSENKIKVILSDEDIYSA